MSTDAIGKGEIRDFGITKQDFGNSNNTQATPPPAPTSQAERPDPPGLKTLGTG
ncbi:MAG: hypothetical protein ACK481_03365 [Candidatus Melainabacteria bacterium]